MSKSPSKITQDQYYQQSLKTSIINEDPVTDKSSLFAILKEYSKGFDNNPAAHIDFSVLSERLVNLEQDYDF